MKKKPKNENSKPLRPEKIPTIPPPKPGVRTYTKISENQGDKNILTTND